MPYSTLVADMVLPDTSDARQDASAQYEDGLTIYYCDEYEADDQSGPNPIRGQCLNRNPWGDRVHNMCYGCMAGYIFQVPEDDPYADTMQIGKQRASL